MDKWIPVREQLPETDEWVQAQTQDGTIYPACYKDNKWSPLFRGGLVEQLFHGKVAYWQPHDIGYPYVQCKCGSFYLQAEGRKECPVCASMGISTTPTEKKSPKTKKSAKQAVDAEELPFSDKPDDGEIEDMLI